MLSLYGAYRGSLSVWAGFYSLFDVFWRRGARVAAVVLPRAPSCGSASFRSENKLSGLGKVRRNHAYTGYTIQILALCLV